MYYYFSLQLAIASSMFKTSTPTSDANVHVHRFFRYKLKYKIIMNEHTVHVYMNVNLNFHSHHISSSNSSLTFLSFSFQMLNYILPVLLVALVHRVCTVYCLFSLVHFCSFQSLSVLCHSFLFYSKFSSFFFQSTSHNNISVPFCCKTSQE